MTQKGAVSLCLLVLARFVERHTDALTEIRPRLGEEDNRLGSFDLGKEEPFFAPIAPPPLQQLKSGPRHTRITLPAPVADALTNEVDELQLDWQSTRPPFDAVRFCLGI